MTESKRPADSELVADLQRELGRLEAERSRAIAKRDRDYAKVETGDDTGHLLVAALEKLKRIEQRIEQVKHLLAKEQERASQ